MVTFFHLIDRDVKPMVWSLHILSGVLKEPYALLEKRKVINPSVVVSYLKLGRHLAWDSVPQGGYLGQVSLGMCRWLLRTPTPL